VEGGRGREGKREREGRIEREREGERETVLSFNVVITVILSLFI